MLLFFPKFSSPFNNVRRIAVIRRFSDVNARALDYKSNFQNELLLLIFAYYNCTVSIIMRVCIETLPSYTVALFLCTIIKKLCRNWHVIFPTHWGSLNSKMSEKCIWTVGFWVISRILEDTNTVKILTNSTCILWDTLPRYLHATVMWMNPQSSWSDPNKVANLKCLFEPSLEISIHWWFKISMKRFSLILNEKQDYFENTLSDRTFFNTQLTTINYCTRDGKELDNGTHILKILVVTFYFTNS